LNNIILSNRVKTAEFEWGVKSVARIGRMCIILINNIIAEIDGVRSLRDEWNSQEEPETAGSNAEAEVGGDE
jgi:hypothetical protein